MPRKVGSKFRTLHKFGKSRRKRRKATVSEQVPETPDSSSGKVDDAVPSTSSASEPSCSSSNTLNVASSRKIDYFKSKKRRHESSDESDNAEDEAEEEELAVADDAVQDGKLNMIVNLGSLQTLISSSGIICPSCEQSVSKKKL